MHKSRDLEDQFVKSKRFVSILFDLLQELLETEEMTDALSGTLEMLIRVLNCEAGAVWLLARETGFLLPVVSAGPVNFTNISAESGVGVEGLVTRDGTTCLISDTASGDYPGSVFDDCGPTVRNMLCVPLKTLTEVVGCIQIVNRKDGESFDAEEVQLCERLAALAALTIEEKGFSVSAGEKKQVLISLRGIIKECPSGDGVLRVLKGIDHDIIKMNLWSFWVSPAAASPPWSTSSRAWTT